MAESHLRVAYHKPGPRDPRHFVPEFAERGEFVWQLKHELKIDRAYQRRINDRRVARIANNWSWVACGCLTTNLREDGTTYVIDGGHRLSAAMMLPEIRELPCLTFSLPTPADEAVGFLSLNVERKPIDRVTAHRAELLSGSPRAMLIDELARECGRVFAYTDSHPSTLITCIATMERCAAQDATSLQRVWPVVRDVCRDGPIGGTIVRALWAAERRMPEGQSLSDNRWRRELLRAGARKIEVDVHNAAALSGNRSETTLALGVTNAVNQHIRGHGKLRLNERPRRGSFKV